jgi:hypothetical protein
MIDADAVEGTNDFWCKACGKTFSRATDKRWIKSFCEKTGRDMRCYQVKRHNVEVSR